MLPQEIEEAQIIGQWLRSRRGGGKVEISVPRAGQPHELVQMAAENATETLQALRTQWQADTHKQEQALAELQSALQLPAPPNRVECYDISHTQGVATVGSMVVFTRGVPDKKLYRRFNIESSAGAPDDFASMQEVLTRRFKRWQTAQEKDLAPGAKPDELFDSYPTCLSWMAARASYRVQLRFCKNLPYLTKSRWWDWRSRRRSYFSRISLIYAPATPFAGTLSCPAYP